MLLANAFEPQKSLKDFIYEELKEHIINGTLVPETRIRQESLASEFRTSRTPIREALRKLEHEGLITIVPGRGAYVSKVCTKEVVDALEIREILEGLAASLYATKMKSASVNELKDAANNYSRAVAEKNFEDILKYDTKFHQIITDECGNNTLMSMLELVHDIILRYRYVYYSEFRTLEKLSGEHELILHAIESGHSDEAKKNMEAHIRNIRNFITTMNLKG